MGCVSLSDYRELLDHIQVFHQMQIISANESYETSSNNLNYALNYGTLPGPVLPTGIQPPVLSNQSVSSLFSPLPYSNSSNFINNTNYSPSIYSPASLDVYSPPNPFGSRSNSSNLDGTSSSSSIDIFQSSPNIIHNGFMNFSISSPASPGSGHESGMPPPLPYHWPQPPPPPPPPPPRSGPQSPVNPIAIPYQPYPNAQRSFSSPASRPQQQPPLVRHVGATITPPSVSKSPTIYAAGPTLPQSNNIIQSNNSSSSNNLSSIYSNRPISISDFSHFPLSVFRRRGSRVTQLVQENRGHPLMPAAPIMGAPLLSGSVGTTNSSDGGSGGGAGGVGGGGGYGGQGVLESDGFMPFGFSDDITNLMNFEMGMGSPLDGDNANRGRTS
ncbi:hypothetical protein BDR26DRAFT_851028 [Obelidium mucronatum]|nr:hypothetical protein BDR26DRAFT_851028 [Obelidium mucronatum]